MLDAALDRLSLDGHSLVGAVLVGAALGCGSLDDATQNEAGGSAGRSCSACWALSGAGGARHGWMVSK